MRVTYANAAKLLARFGATLDHVVEETLYVLDVDAAFAVAGKVRKEAYAVARPQCASNLIGVSRARPYARWRDAPCRRRSCQRHAAGCPAFEVRITFPVSPWRRSPLSLASSPMASPHSLPAVLLPQPEFRGKTPRRGISDLSIIRPEPST